MERIEYQKLHEVEDEMWWFRGVHANLLAAFQRRAAGANADHPVLDAGCGTGGLLAQIGRELPDWRAIGLDVEPAACIAARAKSRCAVCVGSANSLPFADRSLSAIFSADMLCHDNVDERRTLGGFHRCLVEGGLLVLNLPAYDWLLSAHDRAVHNVRRYTRQRLSRLLEAAGFAAINTTYWNTLLFPLMVLRRTLWQSRTGTSDVMLFPGPIEACFRAVMRIETVLLKRGVTLPFGGSVLATAVKA